MSAFPFWSFHDHRRTAAGRAVLRWPLVADGARRRELLPAEPAGDRIVLDMTDVRYCDSSCLQVLLRLGTRLRDLVPAHPTVGAVLATWGEEA
jgi:hypothetical protein